MKRFTISAFFVGLLAMSWILGYNVRSSAAATEGISGQGKMRFKLLYTSSHLPAEAQKVLTGAHGGFAVDLRPAKVETNFGLKRTGIIPISRDLKSTRLVDTPAEMKNTNLHNTAIWYAPDGSPCLPFPGNEANQVFTTNLDGKLVHALHTPESGVDLGSPIANDYFKGRGNFVPTDVEKVDDLLYITTGYSQLDFVLTARIVSTNPVQAACNDLSFGG